MAGMRLNPSGRVWLKTGLSHGRELAIIAGAYWDIHVHQVPGVR